MPCKITMLFNGTDGSGFSESYYNSANNLANAQVAASALALKRLLLLSSGFYLLGYRITILPVVGSSILYRQAVGGNVALPDTVKRDVGSVAVILTGTDGIITKHLTLRGVADTYIEWRPTQHTMGLIGFGAQRVSELITFLTDGSWGWYHAARKDAVGTDTTEIVTLAAAADGKARIGITDTTPYDGTNRPVIAVSGFKGLASGLNGRYSSSNYVVTSSAILTLGRQISAGAVVNYPGGGAFVRKPGGTFTAYTGIFYSSIGTHKVGRPFGSPVGRRSAKR